MKPLLYGPDGSIAVVCDDETNESFDVETPAPTVLSSDYLWLVQAPALSKVHVLAPIEERMAASARGRAVKRLGHEGPRDPAQERRAQAAKRLGGGPIVREQIKTMRYFINGILSRHVL